MNERLWDPGKHDICWIGSLYFLFLRSGHGDECRKVSAHHNEI